MKRVYKYEVAQYGSAPGVGAEWAPVVEIHLPSGAQVLKFDMQRGVLRLWALVDVFNPTSPVIVRKFRIAGTGHDITETQIEYVNTFYDGGLVMHVFELEK